MPAPDEHALRMKSVRRSYAALDALRGIDLTVRAGTAVAVFGANGAGKSTLLRVAAGLLRPSDGRVEIFGRSLPGDASLRRRFGVVAHESFLYPDLTALENLRFYARLYRESDTARPGQLLIDFGLEDASDRPVRTFSRGMIQRLALARATLHRPDLLILDEPFSALDPAACGSVEKTLAAARASGVTIFFSTHDLEGGVRLADRAIILERGALAWDSESTLPPVTRIREIFSSITAQH